MNATENYLRSLKEPITIHKFYCHFIDGEWYMFDNEDEAIDCLQGKVQYTVDDEPYVHGYDCTVVSDGMGQRKEYWDDVLE